MKTPFLNLVQLLLKYINVLFYYINLLNQPQKKIAEPIKPVESKYEKSCKKYMEFYNSKTDDENSNINPILYDFEKRKEIFGDNENNFEKQWKSRILLENTPRGNVMMFYNPYTLSFQYYSDEQIIPYKILQQVSTKYVVMYRCKDFFINMTDKPDNKMLIVLQKEEDSLKSKKMKVNDIAKCVNAHSDSKNVFAVLKDYRTETKPEKSTPSVPASSMIKKPEAEIKFSNKFVRIGKMCEFNISQKPSNKKIEDTNDLMFGNVPVNKAIDFFDDLEIVEHPVMEEKMSSYKMFKSNQFTSKLKTA